MWEGEPSPDPSHTGTGRMGSHDLATLPSRRRDRGASFTGGLDFLRGECIARSLAGVRARRISGAAPAKG